MSGTFLRIHAVLEQHASGQMSWPDIQHCFLGAAFQLSTPDQAPI
jgi:hypothetical protein